MKVFISGTHSGTNPLPGVGVARCIQAAFPAMEIVGVDYSVLSSGLQSSVFDQIYVPGEWHEIDLTNYARSISEELEKGAFWVSCLDLETIWLADEVGTHPAMLIPTKAALRAARKPAEEVAAALGLQVPPYISLMASDRKLHEFIRRSSCRAWLKGPDYGALYVTSWNSVLNARDSMSRLWSTKTGLFLQAHIDGIHNSIAFSAYHGQLLDAVMLEKTQTTPEGKTWSGRIYAVPSEILDRLTRFVAKAEWTGGAEIECILDRHQALWIMEVNPRFPAWIFGAALAGHNLPGLLLGAAANRDSERQGFVSNSFTRIVTEIPARVNPPVMGRLGEQAMVPRLASGDNVGADEDVVRAHPSGMPALAWARSIEVLHSTNRKMREFDPDVGPDVEQKMREIDFVFFQTPARLLLSTVADRRFSATALAFAAASDPEIRFRPAYSLKTNPDPRILSIACANGVNSVDAISQLEARFAASRGYKSSQIILNGPAKWWPSLLLEQQVGYVFCDSIEELVRVSAAPTSLGHVIGIRLRPTNWGSRFGMAVASDAEFDALAAVFRSFSVEQAAGIHFHIASSMIGLESWWDLCRSLMRFGKELANRSGRPVAVVDIGGGWEPSDWDAFLNDGSLGQLRALASQIPGMREVLVEPGKALVQPTMILVSRILDVRYCANGDVREIVVDASVAELPDIDSSPHPVGFYHRHGSTLLPAFEGHANIFGRLCMERDVIVRGVSIPSSIGIGDFVIVGDAGAYDASMSYPFGIGHQDDLVTS